MKKEYKILINYGLYLLTFILIVIIGCSNVFADTVNNQDVTWYYRKTSSESTVHNSVKAIDSNVNLVCNSSSDCEYLNGFTTRISKNFTKGYTYNLAYTLTIFYTSGNDGNFRSDTASRLQNFAYVDSDFNLISATASQISYKCEASLCTRVFSISLNFNAINNTDAIRFGNYTTNNISLGFYYHYIGTGDVSTVHMYISPTSNFTENSSGAIINQNDTIINQNNQMIQQNNENTQDIINNNDSNTQDIINNNDTNTNKIIEDNKKNFQTCRDSVNLLNLTDGTYTSSGITGTVSNGIITLNGTATSNAFVTISVNPNLNVSLNDIISISANNPVSNSNVRFRIDNAGNLDTILNSINKTNTINVNQSLYGNQIVIRVQSGTTLTNFVIKPQIEKGSTASEYEPYGEEICENKLDEQNKTSKGILGKLKEFFDFFNNDEVDNDTTSDTFDDLNSSLPTNSVISDLLLLPVRLLQAIVNSLGGSCSAFNLGSLYGTNLIMPCIDLQSYLGNTIWTFIDLVFSGMFILVIRKKFIEIWENLTNLRNGGNEVD